MFFLPHFSVNNFAISQNFLFHTSDTRSSNVEATIIDTGYLGLDQEPTRSGQFDAEWYLRNQSANFRIAEKRTCKGRA
jgi:hypothetical protein